MWGTLLLITWLPFCFFYLFSTGTSKRLDPFFKWLIEETSDFKRFLAVALYALPLLVWVETGILLKYLGI